MGAWFAAGYVLGLALTTRRRRTSS